MPPTKDRAQRVAMAATAAFAAVVCLGSAGAQNADLEATGQRIMADRMGGNCWACHSLAGQTGPQSTLGPALDGVARKYSAALLRQWVTDARQVKPQTLMPPFGTTQGTLQRQRATPVLSPEDIDAVVAALLTLR